MLNSKWVTGFWVNVAVIVPAPDMVAVVLVAVALLKVIESGLLHAENE